MTGIEEEETPHADRHNLEKEREFDQPLLSQPLTS